jgi:signal transduction histidine kinase/DNA-binding response OmpR family regulator/ligand-binding sensor domain-containing protein
MEFKLKYVPFVLFLLYQTVGLSQQKLFNQLSVNEGFSHSDVNSIALDNYSYLWVGTNSGLNRYDGYDIKTYKWEPNDILSIPGNRILKLIATKDKIWVLIENKGLYYYNLLTKSYVLVKEIPQLNSNNFMFDLGQNQNLWLFHKTIGLQKIDISNKSTSTKPTFSEPIIQEKISFVKNEIELPSLKKLIKTEREELFFTENGHLYIFSKKENKLVFYQDFKSGDFQTAAVKNSTEILVSLEDGIFLWNSISKTKQRIPVLFKPNITSKKIKLRSIYLNNDTYYLGTDNDVYKARLIQQNGLKLRIDQELLSNVRVNSIFKDKFDMLWVATAGYGLFYKNLKNLPFGHIYQSKNNIEAFSKNYTTAVLKEKTSTTLWLGTKNGLLLYNLVSKKYTDEIKELANKQVRFLFQDSENDIWVGTFDDGVYRFRNRKLIAHFKKSTNNPRSISSNHIVSISEDYFGRIWFANYENGIDIYTKNSNSFQHLFNEPFNQESLASNYINYLFYDNNMNFMYVSTRDAGITVVHLNEETKFSYKHIGADNGLNKLSTNYIWSINSINSDSLFVGTIGGGLNILKKDKNNDYQIEYLTKSIGLADNDIESVLLDSENRVWMGGRGISVYDLKTKKITNYDVNDGLQSNSFKIGSSFYDDKEDIMYFGGVNGVNFFDPKLIKTNNTPTIAAITGIEVLNKRVKIGDTLNKRVLLHSKIADTTLINLKAEENDFSINITPINYTAPKSNKIKYRLKPYQKEWIERSYPDYKVSYSNLPAGDYNFEVQASNKDGVWSSKSAELKISIEKIWYKTTLAFFYYFAFSLALLYFLNKQTANKHRIREKLLNAEKEQLLNQGKLDFFTKISHEIRTPLTLISGPLNDLILKRKTGRDKEEVLTSMSRHVNRLLNMTNKLLDFRKMELGHDILLASPTEINEFTNEIFKFFKGKAFSKVITYEFIPLPQEITLYVDKEKIETILINLLSNAFKFTPNNGNITIKLSVSGDIDKDAVFNKYFEPIDNYLEIAVADTGMGIPPSKKENIFNQYYQIEQNSSFEAIGNGIGLALVKSICNLHHLKLAVESKAKKGSVFSIRIPLGKSYLGSDEIKNIDSYVKSSPPIVLHQTPTIDFNTNAIDLVNKTISLNKKILIVEDNAEIRQYLNQHLKEFFKVFNAENGVVGFEIAMKEKPDIILSDVMMPEMNGLEFAKLVKTNDALHHIPIILLTALTSTSNELEGLKLGVEDYIRKPFEIDILLAKIFTILENRAFISEYYAKQLHFTPASLDGLTDDEIFLQKLIKFIEENLNNEELNVAFVSEHMAMGRTKLYVKIKETTGRSIVEFIRDIKLRKAENLLLSSSQTIEQISFQIGINDLKYFRKHFKAIYGLSPSQYRKSKN